MPVKVNITLLVYLNSAALAKVGKYQYNDKKVKDSDIMLIIRNAEVSGEKRDIFINGDKIVAPFLQTGDTKVIDASGLTAAPGLVDMHVHLREPGYEYKEDISSGAMAAAAGGVTSVACMANTMPVTDSVEAVEYILKRAKESAVNVFPIAAVTYGQKGEKLTDFAALKSAGAVAFSDDGVPVSDAGLMREAMICANKLDMTVITHSEDAGMTDGRALNEGKISRELSLSGRPASAEEIMIARDVIFALETGARVHIAHVSTARSVEIIRLAKRAGARVTCETCPQYFILTEDEVLRQGALARVNPPLRTQKDVEGIIEGICDGTIDAIATDHAPHSTEEKARGLTKAPSGMIGLETSLALTFTYLVKSGHVREKKALRLLSAAPAEILGLNKGTVDIGADADIVLFDKNEKWRVEPEHFRSKARNTPFAGYELFGKVKYTVCAGKIVYNDERMK